MSFNDLPPELTAWIVSHLAQPETTGQRKPSIARYASISHKLQWEIEKHIFARLTITSEELPKSEELVIRSRRRCALLTRLALQPVLPTYSDNACAQFERPADHEANNEAFDAAILRLWTALSKNGSATPDRPLHLVVRKPYSPMDVNYRSKEKLDADQSAVNVGKRQDLFQHRYAHSHVQLLYVSDLPLLDRVAVLEVIGDGPRYIAPKSLSGLFRSLPSMETVTLQLEDYDRRYPELRKQLRADFACSLKEQRCNNLESFSLNYRSEGPRDQRFINPDVRELREDTGQDVFCAALKHFVAASPRIKSFSLGGPACIDGSLFWPPISQAACNGWTNIEDVTLDLSAVRPDGG